jgi:hypothetical protein
MRWTPRKQRRLRRRLIGLLHSPASAALPSYFSACKNRIRFRGTGIARATLDQLLGGLTMKCSLCGRKSHTARSCTYSVRCSLCDKPGHNRRTCPNTLRCSICKEPGHNARTCVQRKPLDTTPILRDFPLPIGPRISELSTITGWFSIAILNGQSLEREKFEQALETLPQYENFGNAFRQVVNAVHKASRFNLYVGRAGHSPVHILKRFRFHSDHRNSLWIQPIFRARTELMRLRRWEELAIRWTRAQHELGVLCCNNDVPNDCGPWPSTEFTLVYVAAGY